MAMLQGRCTARCVAQLPAPLSSLSVPSCSHRAAPSHIVRRLRPGEQPQHKRCVARRSGGNSMDDAYESLFKSKVFRSELVMAEFNSIVKEVTGLSQMSSRFPDFDLSGKQMYLDKMEEVCSRYEIFIKRLELSEEPAAKQYLTATNAQMLEGGFTMNQMFMGFRQSLTEYRKWVEQEEKVSADPIEHQKFLKAFRDMWGQSALGKLDLSYLVKTTDPAIILKAQKDPKFWIAIREISTNPSPEVLAKWLDDPNVGPLVAELWKSMQKGSIWGS